MKPCTKCGVDKLEVEFHWRNKAKGRRSSWCKTCMSKKGKGRYQADPAYFRTRNTIRRKALRRWLDEQKAVPCADCRGRFHPVCMDFDHVRGDKVANVSVIIHRGSLKAIKEEIAKCEVVCANCHRIRTLDACEVHPAERLPCKEDVVGSRPTAGSIGFNGR